MFCKFSRKANDIKKKLVEGQMRQRISISLSLMITLEEKKCEDKNFYFEENI